MVLMSISKFAKEVGMTPHHLRKLHEKGEIIPAHITQSGTRYYSTEQVLELTGKLTTAKSEIERVMLYARVSTRSQADDLETQVENLKTYAYARGYQFDVVKDIGSGINYQNKGLKQIIQAITMNKVDRIVILYKDRLVRFGYELIEYLCELNGVTLEVVDQSIKTKEEELADDLIQIVTVFANRLYGSRSKRTRQLIEGVKDVTREKD
ncbi:IS607 family transposase [Tuanshanicoccus lijuaniae]|uniref:IS607 family transposase n=1 Tax=Aerococcaceae bacterium zg-1292 TaxID=2774330 RepID=UPI001BD83035|nr:IS607 family transposase [Aerococcaceae bacterium zg-A91]MBS4458117.1 IS607 family transposase [Aerococcaceae bacterium zg-BR33]